MGKKSQKGVKEKTGIGPFFKRFRKITPDSDQSQYFGNGQWIDQICWIAHVHKKVGYHFMIEKVVVNREKHEKRQNTGRRPKENFFQHKIGVGYSLKVKK